MSRSRRASCVSVHPHARGEYEVLNSAGSNGDGPPPRTWGILNNPLHMGGGTRSTPTHVGNTGLFRFVSLLGSVHPHARGEYVITVGA